VRIRYNWGWWITPEGVVGITTPASEAEFFEIMRMDPVPPIRGATTWPKIRYSVVEHEAEVEQSEVVRQLIQQKLEEYLAPAKMIIYSNQCGK
jgi:hypothetical protein